MLAELCDGHSVLSETFRFAWADGQPTTVSEVLETLFAVLFRAYRLPPATCRAALGITFTATQLEMLKRVWKDAPREATIIENEKRAFTFESDTDGPSRDSEEERKDGDETEVESSDEDEDDDADHANEEDEAYELEGHSECEEEDGARSIRKVGFRASGDNPSDRMDDKATAPSEDLNAATTSFTAVENDQWAELIFGLSISFITEEFTDGQPSSSVLVYYSGILGFTDDGLTFRRAKDYTSCLSGLIYIQRLFLLEYALPYRPYPSLGLDRRPATGHLERLNQVRLQHMVYGCLTPLGEFQSLRAFGRKLAETDPPAFTMRWSEDGQTAYYDDGCITMEAFRKFGHHISEKAETLCDTLMYGWSPDLNLSEVKDDMRNTQLGYSFVQHPANGLSMAYLELCARVCMVQTGGLLHRKTWSHQAIRQYLKDAEALLELLLALLYALGGQAPRATEILSLQHCNGQSTERGVYAYNGALIYVTKHHKAKLSTNKEFNVARFLPARAGKILFYYLVYLRPFTEMLSRELGLASPDRCSNLLFCSFLPIRSITLTQLGLSTGTTIRVTRPTRTSYSRGKAVIVHPNVEPHTV
ncbi:hypothetical protein H2199_008756 [Coniosporium tulheliwenetii]|uniref:Uncharacterized protein n=1 Tax=Coniosporium tulheliwenetii TaxID=3383036 RepID=A0ACC2YIH6_9PEZI|nr:hypothetical protein H2199_008756 [Cladosporium sp. JES 115]